MKEKHCCNIGQYGTMCEHASCFQVGGGIYERSFVFCEYMMKSIYMEPPLAGSPRQLYVEKMYIPKNCPKKIEIDQISMF